MPSAWSLVGFWADKPGWCWIVVRGKYCTMADKPWLKPTSEQAGYQMHFSFAKLQFNLIK